MRHPLTRRAFVHDSTLFLAASGMASIAPAAHALSSDIAPSLRVGLITDLHHADKDPSGTRHYRQTSSKLREAIAKFVDLKTDLVIELGDLIDAAPSVETELGYLNTIGKLLNCAPGDKHYVLGNHCVDTLTKHEFLLSVGQQKSYYSFDQAGWHFVILDGCFNSDGTPYERGNSKWNNANISSAQLDWLRSDLNVNQLPTVVFVHQRLDDSGPHTIKNAVEVRTILRDGNVVAVFQGHSHANDHTEIDLVHYVTQVAMVEGSGEANNGYSILELMSDGSLRLVGFRKQLSRNLKRGLS